MWEIMDGHDGDIVGRVLAGDRAAFGILIDRHRAAVTRLAFRILGVLADAEDVAQDAFLAAFLQLAELRSRPQFAAWVLGIAVHLAKSRLRARREEPIDDWAGGRALPGFDGLDPAPSPEECHEARELHDAVRTAVAALPVEQRSAVELYYIEGLRVWEIAALTGLPSGTVKARLHRARERLRRTLAEARGATAVPAAQRREMAMVEVTVDDVLARAPKEGEVRWFDPVRGSNLGRWRVILLKERDGERVLPVWVGQPEGDTIALQLAAITPQRPMTLNLMARVMELADVGIERVVVTALRDNIFYATLVLRIGDRSHEVDARPSDAIAIALERGARIFVTPEMLALPAVVTRTSALTELEAVLQRRSADQPRESELPEMRWLSIRSVSRP
jgi:RNA polymerase sigma factor (sigma-70 family)